MLKFVDETVGVAEFKSCWKNTRPSQETSTQTKGIKVFEQEVQATECDHAETQTAGAENVDRFVDPDWLSKEGSSPKLLEFLLKMEPRVTKELDKQHHSTAFEGIDYIRDILGPQQCMEEQWRSLVSNTSGLQFSEPVELPGEEITSIHTFSCEELQGQLAVTALSWNSTGGVVAASFGRFDHQGWCTHRSKVCMWTINQKHSKVSAPSFTVDTASCVMATAFHPDRPSVIAGGNFNGEVCLWDTSKEGDPTLTSSGIAGSSHQEPISSLIWFKEPNSRKRGYKLMSSGYDGRLLIWSFSADLTEQKLERALVLQSGLLGSKASRSLIEQEMGIASLSFSSEDNSICYIGSETGGIFRCDLSAEGQPISSALEDISVPKTSLVGNSFEGMMGSVYSVDSSPFHRNLFLACATDAGLRIQTALQKEPIQEITPSDGGFISACWSPSRPLVVALGTEQGSLVFYELVVQDGPISQPPIALVTVQASAKKKAIHSVQFNKQRNNLVATGDDEGVVRVWQLGQKLTAEEPTERATLSAIADTTQ